MFESRNALWRVPGGRELTTAQVLREAADILARGRPTLPRRCRDPVAVAIALVLYGQADHAHVMKVTAVELPFIRAYDSWFYQQSRAIEVLREVADELDGQP